MIIWAIIGILIAAISFMPNRLVDTNCIYTYIGSVFVMLGALVGMSSRPLIAASIVFLGCIVVIYGKVIVPSRK